jgi:hypothetical protein
MLIGAKVALLRDEPEKSAERGYYALALWHQGTLVVLPPLVVGF